MPLDRADVFERDRQRREADRLAAEARRRESKNKVSAADIETCWNALTPEGRAEVALAAVHRLRVRPDLPWLRR
jgi:hypothetical protein